MTYLPELRDSLVKAAARQNAAPVAAPARRRWLRHGLSGLAVVAAAAAAIAVVVIALAVRHGGGSPDQRSAAQQEQARTAAKELLGQVKLPPGAVKTHLHRGISIDLWKPSDELKVPHPVDVYEIWIVRGGVQHVMDFIQSHAPAGSIGGMGTRAGSSSASAGGGDIWEQATQTLTYAPGQGSNLWRQLAIQVETATDGRTVVRVDAQAGRLGGLPASAQIPAGVNRVVFKVPAFYSQRQTYVLTEPRTVRAVVALLNSLPVQPPDASRCRARSRKSSAAFTYKLYSPGTAQPTAIARLLMTPSCQQVLLTIGHRATERLGLAFPSLTLSTLLTIAPVVPRQSSGSGSSSSAASGQALSAPTTRSVPCRQPQATSAKKRPPCR